MRYVPGTRRTENPCSLFLVYRPSKDERQMDLRKCGPYLPGAHIPYNCKEIIVKNQDVFVYPINAVRFLNWQQASGEKVPEKAFKTNTDLYVGPRNYMGTLFCIISAPATSVLTQGTAKNNTALENTSPLSNPVAVREEKEILEKKELSLSITHIRLY